MAIPLNVPSTLAVWPVLDATRRFPASDPIQPPPHGVAKVSYPLHPPPPHTHTHTPALMVRSLVDNACVPDNDTQ